MSSGEEVSYPILLKHDVDYILVIFGGLLGYSGDDINKVAPHNRPPNCSSALQAKCSFCGWCGLRREYGRMKSRKRTSLHQVVSTKLTAKQPRQCATLSCTKCPTIGTTALPIKPPPFPVRTLLISVTINSSPPAKPSTAS